jgi:actin-related protein
LEQDKDDEYRHGNEVDAEINLVIDNGSYTIKAGFAEEDNLRCIVRNVVGYNRADKPGVKKP